MKLKYEWVVTEMGDEQVAVPVGDRADEFHGMIRLNGSAAEIFQLLLQDTTVENMLDELQKKYDSTREELMEMVLPFIVKLIREGVVEGWEKYFRLVRKQEE